MNTTLESSRESEDGVGSVVSLLPLAILAFFGGTAAGSSAFRLAEVIS